MQTTTPRLLRLAEVSTITGYSRDTIYRLGRLNRFPRRILVSDRAARWREDEIREWIEARSAERQPPA
jgi:prophage regulatory protein